MDLRPLLPAFLVLVPLSLKGSEGEISCAVDSGSGESGTSQVSTGSSGPSGEHDAPVWQRPDEFSAEKLEADYERVIAGGRAREVADLLMSKLRDRARAEEMIPVVFQAAEEEGDALAEGEVETDPLGVESPEEMRIEQLELENAELRARLSQVEPFVDPDWPPAEANPKRKRLRFRRSEVRPAALERAARPPLVGVSHYAIRFKPFTSAALNTQMWGSLPRAQAQSLVEQRRFFRNATKALGVQVTSEEYRGVRLAIQEAMLRGELNPRYAVQYLADVVDLFRTYERLERFRLTDGISPPMSADSFRRNPDTMFVWASEVNEHKRKLNRETNSLVSQ